MAGVLGGVEKVITEPEPDWSDVKAVRRYIDRLYEAVVVEVGEAEARRLFLKVSRSKLPPRQ